MKKHLLILLLILSSVTIKAQYADSNYCASSVVVWSEDFGNGFPSQWSIDDSSGYCAWKYSTSGSYGYYNGVFPNSGDTIHSRTPSNGFLICDADSANYYHYGAGNYDTIKSYFTTNAIQLNGNHDLFLEFASFYPMHYYKKYRGDEFYIAVSNDSVNWTQFTIPYLYQLPVMNARYVSYDISPYIQLSDSIYFKFGLNDTLNAWMLDDIRIVAKENYDVAIVDPKIYNTTPTYFGDSLTYYNYTFQSVDTAIGASARIYNRGKQPVYFHFDLNSTVFQPWNGTYNQFYTGAQQSDSLQAGETSAVLTYSFPPFFASSLDYQVNMRVTHNDSVQEFCNQNNTDTVRYALTDYDYDRYKQKYSSVYFSNHIHGFNNVIEIGNLYASPQFQFMTCVHIAVGPNTTPYTQVVANVYEADSSGGFTLVQPSSNYYINPFEISSPGNLKIVHIPTFIYLNPGKNYFVTVTNYLSPNDTLELMALEPAQDSSSFMMDSAGQWQVLNITPYIGLNWFPHHSINELSVATGVDCYPNPASDRIEVSSLFGTIEKIEICDMTGKQVMMIKGEHNHQNININKLAPGLYVVHCYTKTGIATTKFVKQ